MKNDTPENTETPGTGQPDTRRRHKTLFRVGNLLLPLWEGRFMLRTASYAARKHQERLSRLRQTKDDAGNGAAMTFDEAMAASPHTEPVLLRQFLLKKRLWLILLALPVTMALILNTAFFTAGPLPPTLLWRLLSLNLMLAGFAGLTLAKAVQSQFYRWQLQTRQLAPFSDWRRSTAWLKTTLSWH